MNRKDWSVWLTRPAILWLAAVFCCLLWGSAFPAVKLGYAHFAIPAGDTPTQILYAGLRFTLAGGLVLLLRRLSGPRRMRPLPGSWSMIVRLGLVQTTLQYWLFYMGVARSSGVISSIITASNGFWAILISCCLFRCERLTPKKLLGCLCGFCGILVLNLAGLLQGASLSLSGEGAVFLAAVANGLAVPMLKTYSAREDTVLLCGYQFLLGGGILLGLGLLMGGNIPRLDLAGILILLYMGLLSAIAYTIWGLLTRYNPVGRVAVFNFLIPVFGVLLSAFLLQEQNQAFTLQGLGALTLVCLGILLVNRDGSAA